MGSSYSRSYFEDAAANKERERLLKEQDAEAARIANGRRNTLDYTFRGELRANERKR